MELSHFALVFLSQYQPFTCRDVSMNKCRRAVCISWHFTVLGQICKNAILPKRFFFKKNKGKSLSPRWNGVATTARVQRQDTRCSWAPMAEMANTFLLPAATITSPPSKRKRGKIREIGPSRGRIFISHQPTCLLCESVHVYPPVQPLLASLLSLHLR